MRQLLLTLVAMISMASCWSDDSLVDGTFTPAQFAALQDRFRLPPEVGPGPASDAARLGQMLFFDPALSTDGAGHLGTTSCASCHDVNKAFIDSRAPDNNVSQGSTAWTKRNAMTLINTSLKLKLPPQDRTTHLYTWSGKYDSPGQILDLAVTGPFCSARRVVATAIRLHYAAQYQAAFQHPPAAGCETSVFSSSTLPQGPTCVGKMDYKDCAGDNQVFADAERALDAYIAQLVSLHAPFDRYIAGDDSALSDAAKRGFGVFAGRGTCIECHSGPLFTNYEFIDTGVPQTGPRVPDYDHGKGDWSDTPDQDDGKMLTATLRDVALTEPYMHDGSMERLANVIGFYRDGGVSTGYTGTKDPRMVPLDLTDEDATDLEEFLRALTDTDPIPAAIKIDTHVPACTLPLGSNTTTVGLQCGTGTSAVCTDPASDAHHCGSCTNDCMNGSCMGGTCYSPPPPPPTCPMPMVSCNGMCTDVMLDPLNCGSCGHVCAGCVMGMCP